MKIPSPAPICMAIYRRVFARKRFFRLNQFLYQLSLRGIGVMNFESDDVSGEKWFIESLCRNRLKVVIDVGANVGRYSERIVRNNDGVRVFSFEPHPVTFESLKESAERHGYRALRLAVGAEVGSSALYDHTSLDGSEHASVHRAVIEAIHNSQATKHDVQMTTLDAFIEQERIESIDLLKIDTEGNELSVLIGSKSALAAGRIEVIHFEFNVTNVASRVFMSDFYSVLSNYRLFRMLPDGLVALPKYGLNAVAIEIFGFQNIVAVHGRSPLLRALGVAN